MKKSKLLRAAKADMVHSRSCGELHIYVCVNIDFNELTNDGKHRYMAEELTSWVAKLLDGHDTLNTWLEDHYGVHYESNNLHYLEKMYQTRLAWVDWMIEYWEVRGN